MNKLKQFGLALLLSTSIFVVGCGNGNAQELPEQKVEQQTENKTEQQTVLEEDTQDTTKQDENVSEKEAAMEDFSLSDIPTFSGTPYVVVNDNVPYFSDEELSTTSFEDYSELDSLGRCGVAYASI